MYAQLLIAFSAAVVLIILGKKYPFVATAFYLSALVYFVMFSKGRAGLGTISIRFPLPFYRAIKVHHYGMTTNRSVLNMLLFIPFGYLLPTLITVHRAHCCEGNEEKKQVENVKRLYPSWWIVIGAGLLCSLIIETSQLLFKFGVFELDDLVKNTMGAAIGYLIWKGISLKLHKQPANKESSDANN